MSMDFPPPSPPPPPPPDPLAPPAYPLPTSNVQPVPPPVPYPPPPTYLSAPPPALSAHRLPKSRTTAVLLAVFAGFVTWAYTYERDAWKFWTAFAVTVGDAILSTITFGVWLIVAIPVGIGIWIWGIVDAAARSPHFYDRYPAA